MADASASTVLDKYISDHIHLAAPDWYLNPQFKAVLASDSAATAAAFAATRMQFANGVLDTVQAEQPPSPNVFLTTPSAKSKVWGVYAMLMVKDGCEPGLCIGSGTDSTSGARSRMHQYHDKTNRTLPIAVRRLFKHGYDVAHIGLLCWCPIPPPAVRPRARLRLLALEGAFTNLFYSAIATIMDGVWFDLVPWSRDEILWRPLNSHSPFTEGVDQLDLNASELVELDAARVLRAKQHSRKNYAKNAQRMREQYDLERAQDVVAFRLKKRKQAISWVARNKEKMASHSRCSKKKAVETKRFPCVICNKTFADSAKLKRHEATDRHEAKKSGQRPKPRAAEHERRMASIVANKTHYCPTCDQYFSGPKHLTTHEATQKHIAKSTLAIVSPAVQLVSC